MLSDSELVSLATETESDRVERKETLSGNTRDKIGQAICAFANDLPGHQKPGVILIGINDRGVPAGIEITDRLLQDLAAFRSDGNILPLPSLVVELARRRCLENGNGEPEFDFSPSAVVAIVRKGH